MIETVVIKMQARAVCASTAHAMQKVSCRIERSILSLSACPADIEDHRQLRSSSLGPPVFSAPDLKQEVLSKSRCTLCGCVWCWGSLSSILHEAKLSSFAAETLGRVDVLVFRPISDRQHFWKSCRVSAPWFKICAFRTLSVLNALWLGF